jgi:hypothetical protein
MNVSVWLNLNICLTAALLLGVYRGHGGKIPHIHNFDIRRRLASSGVVSQRWFISVGKVRIQLLHRSCGYVSIPCAHGVKGFSHLRLVTHLYFQVSCTSSYSSAEDQRKIVFTSIITVSIRADPTFDYCLCQEICGLFGW